MLMVNQLSGFGAGGAAAAATDPFFSSVIYLGNYTISKEDLISGRTTTLNGAVTQGAGGISSPGGSGDSCTVNYVPTLQLLTNAFCIDGYINISSMDSADAWCGQWGPGADKSWLINYTKNTNLLLCAYQTGGSIQTFSGTVDLSTGVDYHFAWVRNGTVQRCLINGDNGKMISTTTGSTISFDTATQDMWLLNNKDLTAQAANAALKALRITRGNSRYPTDGSSFTPDTYPFATS